jgi:hypothetical protein
MRVIAGGARRCTNPHDDPIHHINCVHVVIRGVPEAARATTANAA